LTADPLVPEPLFGQAYNRYSYVLNNPLRYTDPSGFAPDEWSTERVARIQEAADNAADRPPPAEVLLKVKRRPGITTGPEGGGQPAANGESSDSEGHSAATGATAKPTTADRVLAVGGKLLLHGARNTPVTGLVVRIAEAVYQHVTETKEAEPVTIGEIAALYVVQDGVGKPFGIIDGTVHDIVTVQDDVNAIGEAHSPEDKVDAALDAAEKIARIATAAYGGAKGVQGMVQAAEEKPGASGRPPPRNAHLAGDVHPKTGVPFDSQGYPDFRAAGVVDAEVQISPTGSRAGDFKAANQAAGFQKTPAGFTWHHHQNGTTMQLVPRDIHAETGHTGGFERTRQE
jgi:hypothetical protein